MKHLYWILAVVLLGHSTALAEERSTGRAVLDWAPKQTPGRKVPPEHQLPPLPDKQGFAGAFVGVSGKVLIVAGGANFPYGRPWDEDEKKKTKVWYDHVFVLAAEKDRESKAKWKTGFRLPRPLGYGVSVTTAEGVVCLGGGDAQRHYADVFRLEWINRGKETQQDGKIKITRLPAMPGPAAFFCGAVIGKTIYVAGGKDRPKPPLAMKTFWALDLSKRADQLKWEELEPWPGPARMQSVAAVQDDSFFLIGGVAFDANKTGEDKRVFLNDCYRYDPKERKWTRIADVRIADKPRPVAAAPTPALPLGQASFAVVGGDDGTHAFRVFELKDNHPGFPPEVLVYHTVTDTWAIRGVFPKDAAQGIWPPVTTNTAIWRGRYVVPSGEARPGVRTPNVFWAEPVPATEGFAGPDYCVLIVYLGALVGMGFYFSRREKSTGDFFLGGHRVPWWAAGLSIFGTQLSAITFMSIPAKAYRTDWTYFMANMMIVAIAPAVVFFYLPFYRRLRVTSAYEYLEKRFNKAVRLLGSGAFVLFQLGRMGVVLFLPALALSTVTGINVYACIIVMGALATLYTVLGGIEAVIWTDVLQVCVLLGGALVSLVVIVFSIDGSLGTVFTMASDADKLRLADLDWDIAMPVLWVVVFGSAMQQLVSYTSDQTCVQRYLTTADEKSAARGIWTNAVLTIPASVIFFAVGTALWAFYKTRPDLLNPTGKSDDIFPWFVAQQLPPGVAGLVIAGLFAAAMSSLDSSMNSMATAITTDFYRWLKPDAPDRRCLTLARYLTLLLGLLGAGSAILMAMLNAKSMWDQYMKVIGLFGGGLAGLFALGIFTRRTTGPGAVVGFVASAVVLCWVAYCEAVHVLLYAAVGIVSCFVIGYLASLVIPARRRDLEGLTIFTLSHRPERLG